MIRSVLTLQPGPGRVADVIEVYLDEQILRYSLDNSRALASELSVSVDGSGDILVTALWPDRDAYQEWLDHPNRQRQRLVDILQGVTVGAAALYEIDHSVTKD